MAGRSGDGLHVVIDAVQNTLRLMIPDGGSAKAGEPDRAVGSIRASQAVLDVGEAGRLLGLEIASGGDEGSEPWYLDLEDAPGDQFRSVPVLVSVAWTARTEPIWVDLPRRGTGYELTFPIGNRCWVRPRRSG